MNVTSLFYRPRRGARLLPALLWLLSPWASAQTPLDPLLLSVADAAEEATDRPAVRSRVVRLDRRQLLSADGVAATLAVNLFADKTFIARRTGLTTRGAARFSWSGVIDAVPTQNASGEVLLVFNQGRITANLRVADRVYKIRYQRDGRHRVTEIDAGALAGFRDDAVVLDPPDGGVRRTPPQARGAGAARTIDMLVVYPRQVATLAGDIDGLVQMAEDAVNAGFANSGVIHRLRVVHHQQIGYSGSGNSTTDLFRLRETDDGFADDVHALRETHQADLVSLWLERFEQGVAGRAYLDARFDSAFSVVQREFVVAGDAFAHEIGHNLGANHDRYSIARQNATSADGLSGYSYAFTNRSARWQTIMGTYEECSDAGIFCQRIRHWSNPEIRYQGAPTGIRIGSTGAADNRTTLNQNGDRLSRFLPNPKPTLTLDGTERRQFSNGVFLRFYGTATDAGGAVEWVRFRIGEDNFLTTLANPGASRTDWEINLPLSRFFSPGDNPYTVFAVDDGGRVSDPLDGVYAVGTGSETTIFGDGFER